jgi:fatty acid synthase subunit beta
MHKTVPTQPASALLTAASSGKASIFAIFGGQGTNGVYFDKLQNLYDIYTPFFAPFLQTVAEDILIPLAEEEDDSTFYTYGLDVVS